MVKQLDSPYLLDLINECLSYLINAFVKLLFDSIALITCERS